MKKTNAKALFLSVLILAFLLSGNALQRAAFAQTDYKSEYEKLKKDYDRVVRDRDNILAQSKNLLDYKSKVVEADNNYRRIEQEKQQLSLQIGELKRDIERIQEENRQGDEVYITKIQDLEKEKEKLVKDYEQLQDSLAKFEIEYKIVPETRKKINTLENEKRQLNKLYKEAEEKLNKLEDERIDKDAQIEIYRLQISDAKKRYDEALAKNMEMQRKLQEMPERMAELSRENKVLIKETALMHYNLGVFYTKNKEYTRAAAEFEKSIELNPDDPYAYYNLGYLYAEYILDRPKAIDNFRKFLRLVKTEDKDVDWVKKYILTWQTWEGKKPMQ